MTSKMTESPYEKSIQFLKDICELDGVEILRTSTIYKIIVRVRGRSGRHYEVIATRPIGLFSQEPWQTTVTGAAWKNDFDSKNTQPFTASLCLSTHEEKRHLPIGDHLASLVLSLHNDVKLAMDIPLVAQFIVCPREDLYNVYSFQNDMVVTQDMIDEQQEFEEEYDAFFEDDFEDVDLIPDFEFLDDDDDIIESELQERSFADQIADLFFCQQDKETEKS
jgi:hypothetical protein